MRSNFPKRFALIRILREGQDSKTFLANDHLLDRENVIVKIVRKDRVRSNREQLIEQFSWLIGVQHAQFAAVLDAGLTNQQHFYYVREYLPASELPSVDPLTIVNSLVSAVDFLSKHGRIHGGIKPSNIFVTKNTFKLADKRFVGQRSYDEEESVHFEAPEILDGGDISHEGDLYSLGATLYFILSGRHLFEDSDLSRLRSKYVSARPQLGPYLSPVSQVVCEPILELISQYPARRPAAFERLKRAIVAESVVPDQGMFVGRHDLLQQTLELSQKPTPTLRVALLEGGVGVGKSRFVTELRLHCAFYGSAFVVWQCRKNSPILAPIREGLGKLLCSDPESGRVGSKFELRELTPASEYLMDFANSASVERKYPLEKLISDVIGLIGALGRRVPLVLTIEDVDLADAGTVLFLKQLAFRASETPLTLVLTRQPSEIEPEWLDTIAECLGANFLRRCLPVLSESESESLVRFLAIDRERQVSALQFSAGNPLFIVNYAKYKSSRDGVPSAVVAAATSMLSKLTKYMRAVLQVLSVFRKPVHVVIVARLCQKSVSDLQTTLDAALRMGLIKRNGETLEIRFPVVQRELYSSIPKETRMRLNRGAFLALRELETDNEALSHYAFEAGMFREAAMLYRDLANTAYSLQKYRAALNYYDRLRKCNKFTGESFTPAEILNIARCYDKAGKRSLSTPLYKELLSFEGVKIDPELLSTVYSRLAVTTDSIAAEERNRFLERALQCLPDDPSYIKRYAALSCVFSRIGNLARAREILKQAEAYLLNDNKNDSSLLNVYRATVLSMSGDFRGAAEYYQLSFADGIERSEALNNLACCFEYLGDLNRALQYQLRARDVGAVTGNLFVEISSLVNIAAIKTKSGDTREAEDLLNQARNRVGTINAGDMVDKDSLLLTTRADTAIHAVHMGHYRQAYDCIKNIRTTSGSVFYFDRVLCEITRCKFFIEIGLTRKVRGLLGRFANLTIFNVDFLRVERALVEARLPEIPAEDRCECLLHAFTLSVGLGTVYQQCELLISLASVNIELNEKQKAHDYVNRAVNLADKNGYRLLAPRGLLLLGLTCDTLREKLHFLSDALQLATEMGLQELIAEATYHIGILNLESGNTVTAREYLIRSTSLTARLAEGVPNAARSKYLGKQWRRDALQALNRCNESIPLHGWVSFNTDGDKYFTAVYRFTMSAAAAKSLDVLLTSIEKTLDTAFPRSAVITLRKGTDSHTIPVRIKLSPELTQRIEFIRTHAKDRLYFESADEKGKQVSAWIPLKSETCEGGIYVACRSHESQFTEKEIELMTMVGTIASNALKRLETRHAEEAELREFSEFYGIIGASKPIKEVYSQIQMAAGNVATVLIEGESGTGKELVAKAIHAAGPRAKAPFIAVDCGAIPEALIEAELFGSKKGSYTGAVADRPGLFEAAHHGTILLDEISNTTPALQVKLLRVIQEREVRRIGETKGRAVDVRLIVASNQSLEALADAGQFRKDLLYRLKVLHIKVPPLRHRRDDIPMLAHAFLQKLNTANKTRKYLAQGVIDHLSTQKFPGNVRELQNAVERAYFSAKGIMITEAPLDVYPAASAAPLDEIQTWFKDISEGRKDFWSAIHNRYKRRDISREKVVAFVDFGLRATRGSYKTMASMFRLNENDYRRFMDFLRRNDCLLDFRPYRKAATASREN
jgi:DNA-binding NtrC family response regulator/tetratricopeptide (TPR) repeat protein